MIRNDVFHKFNESPKEPTYGKVIREAKRAYREIFAWDNLEELEKVDAVYCKAIADCSSIPLTLETLQLISRLGLKNIQNLEANYQTIEGEVKQLEAERKVLVKTIAKLKADLANAPVEVSAEKTEENGPQPGFLQSIYNVFFASAAEEKKTE